MQTLRIGFRIGLLAVLAAGCGPIPSSITINLADNTQGVEAIVQATIQAMTAQAGGQAAATPSPAPSGDRMGSISGSPNYPSESLPAMHVTAFQVGTQNYRYVSTNYGKQTFRIDDLAPGTYHVVAYTIGSQGFPAGLVGGYTQAVPCGLSVNCNDHILIDISVAAGQAITGINPADWYLVDDAFRPFPGPASPTAGRGTINGTLMYPSSGIPALRIVAFQVPGNAYYFVDTVVGQSSYTIESLHVGTYHVVAYVRSGGHILPAWQVATHRWCRAASSMNAVITR
ncbi:MAG: hypothetical protein V1755_16090 [Chloroflexota bacterium]